MRAGNIAFNIILGVAFAYEFKGTAYIFPILLLIILVVAFYHRGFRISVFYSLFKFFFVNVLLIFQSCLFLFITSVILLMAGELLALFTSNSDVGFPHFISALESLLLILLRYLFYLSLAILLILGLVDMSH